MWDVSKRHAKFDYIIGTARVEQSYMVRGGGGVYYI